MSLKIFLSYSSKDYELAKEIKEVLENCGLNVFLAHTSIEPTKSWEEEICKNLKECDVFIPILTNNFKESNWTSQESGIAFNERKTILSLKIDIDPFGFLGQFQALNFNISSSYELTKFEKKLEIIKTLMINFSEEIRKSFIFSLKKTGGYKLGTAKCRFLKELEKISEFNEEEINEIIKSIINNPQLYDAHEVKPYLTELIERYEKKVESNLKEEVMNKIKREEMRSEILKAQEESNKPYLSDAVEGLLDHMRTIKEIHKLNQ